MPSKAKFSNKVKEEIFERDGKCCILCGMNTGLQFHHYKFGLEANRGDDRNEAKEGVTVCDICHLECHSCKSGEGKRQDCFNYINGLGY